MKFWNKSAFAGNEDLLEAVLGSARHTTEIVDAAYKVEN